MGRPGPKSKKQKAGPKSKKEVKDKEPEILNEESEEEMEEKKVLQSEDSDNENGEAERNQDDDKDLNENDPSEEEEEEEEPPAKKGRGRPGKKKAPAKSNAKTRKTPSRGKPKKPSKSESEDEEEYEVEKIMNVRKRKAGKEYLIKWKGYSHKSDTWEPVAHLNCDEAIQKFEDEMEKAKNTPARALREERKETDRYADVAERGEKARLRHSRRNASSKTTRKTYKEAPDSD